MDEPRPDPLPSHDGLTSIELEDALTRRAPVRWRLARGALAAAALVLALGALLRNTLPLPHWSLAAAPTPTSHVRSAPFSLQQQGVSGAIGTPGPISIYSNVSYGVVTLNGKRLRGSPPISLAGLPPGHNTLTLDATPFPRVTCAIDAIGASTEAGTAYQASAPCRLTGAPTGITIIIVLTGADLAPTVAARALSTLHVAVSQLPTEYADVPAGEYYATGTDASGAITYAQARQPLAALLDYAPNTVSASDGNVYLGNVSWSGNPCVELDCSDRVFAFFSDPASAPAWLVSEPVLLRMRFETPDGTPMGAVTVPAMQPRQFAIAYRADGTWQTVNLRPPIEPQLASNGDCGAGANLLVGQLLAAHTTITALAYGGASSTLAGCQISVTSAGNYDTFIWRFGVLLALDAGAHALLPGLPVAPPSEIQAVGAP